MAPRATRSKGPAAAASAASTTAAASKYSLPPESASPPSVFILPKRATPAARIVTLPHPRYKARPTRYLVCPETGVYEFTRIACPKATPRSWLIARGGEAGPTKGEKEAEKTVEVKKEESSGGLKQEQEQEQEPEAEAETNGEKTEAKEEEGGEEGEEAKEDQEESTEPNEPTGPKETTETQPPPPHEDGFDPHVSKSADLYVASPFDPLFLLLPALAASSSSSSSSSSMSSSSPPKRLFLTPDDHFDALPQEQSHLAELLRLQVPVNALFVARMAAVCDTVEAGDESMFRLNEDKLLLELLGKAQRMSRCAPSGGGGGGGGGGLPASMEEKFVTKALEAPVMSLKSKVNGGGGVPSTTTTTTTTTADAESSLAAEAGDDDVVAAAMQAPDEVVALQRLRVAFHYLCARYVPPAVARDLQARLATPTSGIDFGPLDAYLARLATMRQQVLTARSAALDYASSRKRTLEEENDDRAEKRRKREEEEKRKKAGQSRGVRDLKKVNTSGMKKLSEFFKKT